MDKFQALQSFWSSFGIDAWDESTVPTGDSRPELPYITYNAEISDFRNQVSLFASIWYYGTNWGPITAKLAEIENVITRGGILIPCDSGAIWIKKGSPFAQRVKDPDDMIRRIYINIEAEYITAE